MFLTDPKDRQESGIIVEIVRLQISSLRVTQCPVPVLLDGLPTPYCGTDTSYLLKSGQPVASWLHAAT